MLIKSGRCFRPPHGRRRRKGGAGHVARRHPVISGISVVRKTLAVSVRVSGSRKTQRPRLSKSSVCAGSAVRLAAQTRPVKHSRAAEGVRRNSTAAKMTAASAVRFLRDVLHHPFRYGTLPPAETVRLKKFRSLQRSAQKIKEFSGSFCFLPLVRRRDR